MSTTNILQEYLLKLGFETDEPSFAKFQRIMEEAEHGVTAHTGGMLKRILEFQAGAVGVFATVSAAIVGLVDKVAMSDQAWRLQGMRLLMNTEQFRKMDLVTKALGASIEEIQWDPSGELQRNAGYLAEHIDKLDSQLGPNFESKVKRIRDMRLQFELFRIDLQYLQSSFVVDLFDKLFPNGNALEKITTWVEKFEGDIPRLADKLSTYAVPVLKDAWGILQDLRDAGEAGATAFTNFVGVLSGDTSIEGSEFSWEKLAKAIEHVESAIRKAIHAMTEAETVFGFGSAGVAAAAHGKFDVAQKNFEHAGEHMHVSTGIALGIGGLLGLRTLWGAGHWALKPFLGAGGAQAAGGAAEGAGAAASTGTGILGAVGSVVTPLAIAAAGGYAGVKGAEALEPTLEQQGWWQRTHQLLKTYEPTWLMSAANSGMHFFGEKTDSERGSAAGQTSSGGLDRGSVSALIESMADKYGVPRSLALAIAQQESGLNQAARSKAGAIGTMQLMPATAARFGEDPNKADENVIGGVKYLRFLMDHYHGDIAKAAAAYNAGEGRVDRAQSPADLPAETRNYVPSVLRRLQLLEEGPMGAGGDNEMSANTYPDRVPSWYGDIPRWMREEPSWYAVSPEWMRNVTAAFTGRSIAPIDGLDRPLAQPAYSAPSGSTTVTMKVDVHVNRPGASEADIARAVKTGTIEAMREQTGWVLPQLAPAW